MGRWRLDGEQGRSWSGGLASLDRQGTTWTMRREGGMEAYASADPDSGGSQGYRARP